MAAPMATLKIEYIGEAQDARLTLYHGITKEALGKGVADALIGKKRMRMPWVAKVTGRDEKYGFHREFLAAKWLRRDANSTQSRGVMLEFDLQEGQLYQVHSFVSWRREDRYFCVVNAESIRRISENEVMEWLKKN